MYKIIICLFCVVLFIIFGHKGEVKKDAKLLDISARLGGSMEAVKKSSTYPISAIADQYGYLVNSPHNFIYNDTKWRIQFNNVESSNASISLIAYEIIDISVVPSPSIEADKVWPLLQNIIEKFYQSGWRRDREINRDINLKLSPEMFKKDLMDLPSGTRRLQAFWYDDLENRAWVEVIRAIGSSKNNPRFNVVIRFSLAVNAVGEY